MLRTISLYILTAVLTATVSGAENTGLSFLKIGVGARATAMGGAVTALSDDVTGQFWNPAGTAWSSTRTIHFTHNSWIQGINHESANLLFPAFKGMLGFGLILNSVSDIERRTIASDQPIGTFSAHDFSLGVSFAKKFGKKLSFGLQGKFINEKIYFDTASGFAIDLGFRYKAINSGLYLGGAVQNLGTMNELAQQPISLPTTLRLGAAFLCPAQIFNSSWTFSVDYVKVSRQQGHLFLGVEVKTVSVLVLRGGYQAGLDERNLSAGFGVNLGAFQLDYAYIPFTSNLGSSQLFSISTSF